MPVVHELRHVLQVCLRQPVDARLVAGAVDDDGRMPAREGDDRGELVLAHEVGRLHLNEHAEFVRRLEILLRRDEGVEAHEVETELLALRRDHPVIREIPRQMDRLRKVAVFRHAAQIDGLAVEPKLRTVRDEPTDAKQLTVLALRRRERQRIAFRIFGRPEFKPRRRQREVARRTTRANDVRTVGHSPVEAPFAARHVHGERLQVGRRGHVDIRKRMPHKSKFTAPVDATRRGRSRAWSSPQRPCHNSRSSACC